MDGEQAGRRSLRALPCRRLRRACSIYWGPFGNPFSAGNGMPAIGPPWAELVVAYDLNEGDIKRRTALGTILDYALRDQEARERPPRHAPTAGGSG